MEESSSQLTNETTHESELEKKGEEKVTRELNESDQKHLVDFLIIPDVTHRCE